MVSCVDSFCPFCGLRFLWWFCVVGLVLVACPGLWGLCLVVVLGCRTWVLFDWLFVFVVPVCGYFIRFIFVSG